MSRIMQPKDLKQALIEGFRENRDDLRDLLAEVFEDVALANAIRQGQKSKPVKREAVIKALKRRK